MGFLASAVTFVVVFIGLRTFHAVSINLIFLALRRPFLWLALQPFGAFALIYAALALGGPASSAMTATVAVGAWQLWKAKTPSGVDASTMRAYRDAAWASLGIRHGSAVTWSGLALLVVGGVAGAAEVCAGDTCRPLIAALAS
ncbi:hypothetical protein [uncultured Brevundimonas sp.]|uniref:hypothetical protein n=1 Tax=uncultured Brevundimonas sp. TaxID=213418 RepID=UPI002599CE3D|nr:hypothetical protein [uncultured Brevundimonas sp.]